MYSNKTEIPRGSVNCPRCQKRDYEHEGGNRFRCTSCNLLVDALAKPIQENHQKSY